MAVVGLGIDLVHVSRIERLTQRNEDIFRSRILGETERAEIPLAGETRMRNAAYACSVAAKEALLKALGTGLQTGTRWPDIEIVRRRTASPLLSVSGEPRRAMENLNVDSIHFSISMAKDHALATVLLTRNSNNGTFTR